MTGLRPCLWTVLQCKEQEFQQFLGVEGEEAATRAVKERLAIESRAELDRDPEAAARWNRMRRAFMKYQQQKHPTTHHN